IATGATHIALRRRKDRAHGVSITAWLLLGAVIVGGCFAAKIAGEHERDRLRNMLQGIAPTYAQELSRMGHAKINFETKPDDALYLSLIQSEIRWLKVNPAVNNIYTFRKSADGKVHLLVDSETDN